jgi:RNA polymerase sigma factor (sigma-70 family)
VINLIDQFPKDRLSREEEATACTKDPTKLVLHSMREAILYTQRCCRDRIPEDERASICYQKLSSCVNRFKPGGIRFFSFAKAGLRGAMKDYWTAQNSVRNAKGIVSVDQLSGWNGPDRKTNHRSIGLGVENDEQKGSLRERVTGEVSYPETDEVCSRDQWAQIEKLVGPRLNDRQRMVLTLVYKSGLNFPEIGKLLGVTRSLIHSIHRDTVKLIRSLIAADGRLLEK